MQQCTAAVPPPACSTAALQGDTQGAGGQGALGLVRTGVMQDTETPPPPCPAPAHPGLLINIIPVIALLRPARPARPSWRKLAGWAEQVWWPTVEG